MPYDQIGKVVIILGIALLVLGGLLLFVGRTSFGKLPGDITWTSGNFTCIAPIATMLLLSLLLTIIVNVVSRLFNR